MTIQRHLSRADQAADPYAYLGFDLPAGVTRIDVALDYPKAEDCIIDLGCVDPAWGPFPSEAGFRGWSGGARDGFFIARDDATPGYVPGEMAPGRWHVMLGLYRLPEDGVDVTVQIALDDSPRQMFQPPVFRAVARAAPGWYRGDLHCHTFHSDARGAPEVLHQAARQAGLDFLAVSDHNTITQRRYFHSESSPDLVFLRAMEVTTAEGHANVYGLEDWVDFRLTSPGDAHVLAAQVAANGGLLSINHDKFPIPWKFDIPRHDCMEVWQSAWPMRNWEALEKYQARLASGRRISLIGGSDFHQPEALQPEGPLVLARPCTVLWLEELSEAAILQAMRTGRGYVTEAPDGPHLAIACDHVPMGGTLPAGEYGFTAEVIGAEGDELHWYDARGLRRVEQITSASYVTGFTGCPEGFLRAEVVADAARERLLQDFLNAFADKAPPLSVTREDLAAQPMRRALSNPIYVEGSS